jgi:hypothetical protein
MTRARADALRVSPLVVVREADDLRQLREIGVIEGVLDRPLAVGLKTVPPDEAVERAVEVEGRAARAAPAGTWLLASTPGAVSGRRIVGGNEPARLAGVIRAAKHVSVETPELAALARNGSATAVENALDTLCETVERVARGTASQRRQARSDLRERLLNSRVDVLLRASTQHTARAADADSETTPLEAALGSALQRVAMSAAEREAVLLEQLADLQRRTGAQPATLARRVVRLARRPRRA